MIHGDVIRTIAVIELIICLIMWMIDGSIYYQVILMLKILKFLFIQILIIIMRGKVPDLIQRLILILG